jgi:hypothetical protein
MAKYSVNKRAVAKARDLINTRQDRVRSRWAVVQPRAAEQNAFVQAHGWAEYASWHPRSPMAHLTRRKPVMRSCRRLSGKARKQTQDEHMFAIKREKMAG